jgi:hypothetical protein
MDTEESTSKMDTHTVTALHSADESPWPNVSPEFDAQMIQTLKSGIFVDKETGVSKNFYDTSEDGRMSTMGDIRVATLEELRDTNNQPVVAKKRYSFREADHDRSRMLDYENGNKRKIVNNAKWHDGLHMKIWKRYSHTHSLFMFEYPGGSDWLTGIVYNKDDVKLVGGNSTSAWMLEPKGNDKEGHPCYAVWTQKWGATEYKYGFWMPEYAIARAGYDNDYEWRTYNGGTGAPQGFFNIKLERVDYNE